MRTFVVDEDGYTGVARHHVPAPRLRHTAAQGASRRPHTGQGETQCGVADHVKARRTRFPSTGNGVHGLPLFLVVAWIGLSVSVLVSLGSL